MKVKIIYYISPGGSDKIREFVDTLENKQQAKVLRLFRLIEEYGLSAVGNHLKKLSGAPFWEIRILGKDNIRFLYLVVIKDTILVLNGFVKKEEKTPTKEIDLASKRYEDWLVRKAALDK